MIGVDDAILLEWQVIFLSLLKVHVRSWSYRSWSIIGRWWSGYRSVSVDFLGFPSTYVGVVASLILSTLNVETEVYHVAYFEWILVGPITEEVEINLAWETVKSLE
jgi:hypothetical protein